MSKGVKRWSRSGRSGRVWLGVLSTVVAVSAWIGAKTSFAAGRPAKQPETALQKTESTRRFGVAEAPEKKPGTIRLATYNAENLFDDKDDPALTGRNEDKGMTKPASERAALAATIRAVDPDVLAMEEVESESALKWFVDEYISDMGYKYIVSIDDGDARGIEQSVLSRYPLTDAKVWPHLPLGGVHPDKWGNSRNYHAGEPLEFHRSPLRVTVHVPVDEIKDHGADDSGYAVTLYVVHHKSGRNGEYWRDAEAKQIVRFIGDDQKADPSVNIAVLGDFNAEVGDQSVDEYLHAGMIDVFAGHKPNDPAFVTHESGHTFDHILVNQALEHEIVDGSRFVYGTPARPAGSNWRTTPPPPGYASDHYPVVVDLTPRDE